MTASTVFLGNGATGEVVLATLYDSIQRNHLIDHERHWKPLIEANNEEHDHWDWGAKFVYYSTQLHYEFFALECSGQTQGLMIVNTSQRCRVSGQTGQHLAYIEYLETAPWNRGREAKYKGVGATLVVAAIQLSLREGNLGRIGLHSLPQADSFYRGKCGMTDLGLDHGYPNCPLRYFEMTEDQATTFMQESRRMK